MAKRFNSKEFCALSLSKQDKTDFEQWLEKKVVSQQDAAGYFLENGYKLSCTWVRDSNAFCLSVIGTDDCHINQDAIMTSWSQDYVEVHQLALYKHVELCNEGEWPTQTSGERWG